MAKTRRDYIDGADCMAGISAHKPWYMKVEKIHEYLDISEKLQGRLERVAPDLTLDGLREINPEELPDRHFSDKNKKDLQDAVYEVGGWFYRDHENPLFMQKQIKKGEELWSQNADLKTRYDNQPRVQVLLEETTIQTHSKREFKRLNKKREENKSDVAGKQRVGTAALTSNLNLN